MNNIIILSLEFNNRLLYVSLAMLSLVLVETPLIAATYSVGSGLAYDCIGDVPWDVLEAGDSVLIHYRDSVYHEKWVLCCVGTFAEPVVVRGIPDEFGNLPVIDGRDAVTPPGLNFWNEERGVIKIGGANNPPDTMPAYIIIENLDIKSGRPPYAFTGRYGLDNYVNNCAAIYIEKGEHIIIRNCTLRDCGNGLFCGHQATDLVVEGCYIVNNGIEDRIYEHNNYTEAFGILFQFNHFDSLRTGCEGNNLKDRSAGCIIRYNWIEDGNRQLDLVDTDYEAFYSDSIYNKTYVYGNILVENEGEGNSQIIHYGGDSGVEERYRKGTLLLYNNTIISTRSGNTTLVRLSSDGEACDARNNIIYTTATGDHLAMLNDAGTIELRNNWLRSGWVNTHSPGTGVVNDYGNVEGSDPGFANFPLDDLNLSESSPCINAGASLHAEILPELFPTMHYIRHCLSAPRPEDDTLDIGAYEYLTGFLVDEPQILPDKFDILCYPNPFSEKTTISYQLLVSNTQSIPSLSSPVTDFQIAGKIEIYDINGRLVFFDWQGCLSIQGRDASVTGRDACPYRVGGKGMHQLINAPTHLPSFSWQPDESIPSGVYMIRVQFLNTQTTRRVVYLK
ncbi:right-handed parallel beta-helix repeat-containing protein [bacterium]|nr:right-handed parallel beta-helix repeat-containing protein [bacterium]